MNRLIVLYGATGVGKTELSIELSKRFNAPILSSDSRQVYREMSIGTAVPTDDELAAAPHYFIKDRSIEDRFSAGDFEKEGLALLERLFKGHQNVLLVGGSNLYINALLYGFDDLPSDFEVRKELSTLRLTELQQMLLVYDPIYHHTVDLSNIARVRRAVEVCIASGKPYSAQRKGEAKHRDFEIIKIGLERPRAELYERINYRVDKMILAGLEDEARTLYSDRELPALQTVGYREMFDYFADLTSFDQAVELIKRNTRHYAKRQTTWLRSENIARWFSPTAVDEIGEYIASLIALDRPQ